jgi:hypothetical protein
MYKGAFSDNDAMVWNQVLKAEDVFYVAFKCLVLGS